MPESGICTITVDGKQLLGVPGLPLVEFLAGNGIDLPHICYHKTLGALQTCDTCWVEVNGELRRGCTLKAEDGLVVDLDGDNASNARREGIDRIVARHELYCSVCENNNGDCRVHNVVRQMDVPYQRYPFRPKPYAIDDSHPMYRYDPDQCILCGRCVEACQNVQVTETLSIDWKREDPRVLWDGGEKAGESSCVSCGHCVTVCPCNALIEKSMLGEAGPLTAMPRSLKRPAIEFVKEIEHTVGFHPIFALSEMDEAWRQSEIKKTKTVCTFCGVGCAFELWTRGRKILKVQPVEEAPVNGISTCIKGKFGWDFVNSDDRLTTPLIRENGRFREAGWDEAYALIARRFTEIRDQHGPDAMMFVASSKCTNEESYLMQKLARAVIGTNNIDNCSRYCQAPATQGLWRTMGYGGDGGSISDLEQAEVILFLGSNTAESHPVLATRLKQAHKHRGQKHIVFDLRRHEMAERADIFLRPKPGTDLIWLSAVSKYILDHGLEDEAFLKEKVKHLEEYRKSLEPFTMEYAEEMTGIAASRLEEVARTLAAAETLCAVWAMGVTQHVAGSDTSTAIANLLLVTGNSARRGTGAYPMRGHNNVQGCSDFGSMPDRFPGYEFVSDDEVRARYEDSWGVKLSTNSGYNNHTLVEGIHDGKIKSLYIMGEEMAIMDADAHYVQSAFDKLEFVVVQDIFFSRTCEHADVILPAAPSLEKEGTFVNTERRLQRLYQVMEPLGNSKPDWLIQTEIARALGADWDYPSPREIMEEAASLAPMFAGVTYERLEGYKSLQWPIAADGTDTPHLYLDGFAFPDGKAKLYPLEFTPPSEQTDEEFDLHVNNGRLLETFHEGNLTHRSAALRSQVPMNFVEVSPQLARKRGIQSGSLVKLISRHGEIQVRVLVTDRVEGKELYIPENATDNIRAINLLTSDEADKDSDTPAYKEIAAKMEVLEVDGESPLPRQNFRFWKPTPIEGVRTELKWQRPDYVQPPKPAPHPEKF
ncbi:formate dehydrogenase subunit alpha [Microbulbifer rhizosphaerae]|uniref:nitrate reductase (cytochrome) n=1 Tax=Microbulbifer rhizosphaerae TaxID=1562603 RepID=A0A7W4WAI9_9GAMM|nr:formate dehydrogenase subunit alpha [Microbulbifer rhizosphaerae]MBB3060705.1 formate dehydrogenase major subunit [Microbulbifer rhizosphaerae]